MSTTRSQKRRNNLPESTKNVSDGLVSPVVVEILEFLEKDVSVAGSSNANSPGIGNTVLESLRKRAKTRSQSQPASKERPIAARTIFALDKSDSTTLPLPKALTASLPTFDGYSEKVEYFRIFSPTTSKCIGKPKNKLLSIPTS